MADIKDVFLPDTLVVRSTISPDKQVVTTLVQSLQVQLPPRPQPLGGASFPVGRNLGDPPLVATQTASLFVDFAGTATDVTVRVRIMGFVDLKPGARATLVSRIAGTTFTDDPACAAKDGLYELSHTVKVTPANGLLLTFFLLIDRNITDNALPEAFAAVESVEFNLEAPSASAK